MCIVLHCMKTQLLPSVCTVLALLSTVCIPNALRNYIAWLVRYTNVFPALDMMSHLCTYKCGA